MASLPTTPTAAPPNFYSQAGAMQAGQTSAGQATPATPGDDPTKDQEFLENTTKLLGILDKMSELKPRGQDVSKFMQAAAAPIKDCVKHVFNQDPTAAGSTPADGSVADTGAAGAAGAGASAPPADTGTST